MNEARSLRTLAAGALQEHSTGSPTSWASLSRLWSGPKPETRASRYFA